MAHGFSPKKLQKIPQTFLKNPKKALWALFCCFLGEKPWGDFCIIWEDFVFILGEKVVGIFVFLGDFSFSAFLNLSKLYDYVLN
jgi:hypothetical protein